MDSSLFRKCFEPDAEFTDTEINLLHLTNWFKIVLQFNKNTDLIKKINIFDYLSVVNNKNINNLNKFLLFKHFNCSNLLYSSLNYKDINYEQLKNIIPNLSTVTATIKITNSSLLKKLDFINTYMARQFDLTELKIVFDYFMEQDHNIPENKLCEMVFANLDNTEVYQHMLRYTIKTDQGYKVCLEPNTKVKIQQTLKYFINLPNYNDMHLFNTCDITAYKILFCKYKKRFS